MLYGFIADVLQYKNNCMKTTLLFSFNTKLTGIINPCPEPYRHVDGTALTQYI